MVLLKFVVVAASLGTAYFIWSFLGRTSPSTQILGVLAYLWNPMILAEFAGEGHNDALIVLFVIAALAACAAGRPATSMVAQMLGILTKYISLMFCPAQLVFFWRTRRGVARLALEVAAASTFVAAIAIALYSHLWAGSHTFDGLLRRAQPISSASPFGAVNWILRRSPWASVAAPLTVACVTLPLLVLVAWVSWKVRDAADLARAFAWISLGYVLVASPDYWPWYACMPVTLIIISDVSRLLWLAILMSFTARLCAPLDVIRDHGFLGMVASKGALTGLDATLPLTIGEYEEWGNPEDKVYYETIRSYSPYDNVEAKPYPAMLITAGLNDPRVSYWEPAKWAAKLRALKKDGLPACGVRVCG
jgi:Gpi18-like mannosyltransferase